MQGDTATTYKRRLRKLAKFLQTRVPTKRFYMGSWWMNEEMKAPGRKLSPEKSCGTTACALGWATAIPEFYNKGLHLDKQGGVLFRGGAEEDAGRRLFGLNYDGFARIFYGEGSPKKVAKAILKVVDDFEQYSGSWTQV